MRGVERRWVALSPGDGCATIAQAGIQCWVAGGWAIDLFLGRTTRSHGDLDLAMLRDDCARLTALLGEWELHVADSGKLVLWDGSELEPNEHQFWARRRGADEWSFEILLEDHAEDLWLYRRDHRISAPVTRFGSLAPNGTPIVAPEIALLYKSRIPWHELERNARDFSETAPVLADDARGWLTDALKLTSPDHPWLADLQ